MTIWNVVIGCWSFCTWPFSCWKWKNTFCHAWDCYWLVKSHDDNIQHFLRHTLSCVRHFSQVTCILLWRFFSRCRWKFFLAKVARRAWYISSVDRSVTNAQYPCFCIDKSHINVVLKGQRLKGVDVYRAGVATHYVESEKVRIFIRNDNHKIIRKGGFWLKDWFWIRSPTIKKTVFSLHVYRCLNSNKVYFQWKNPL